ncbi:MAG: heavy-metal-associated domain-containing protein [Acidobacteria bacterium]|nr:heavy-metal-associated domain-containing protein [Acidobacteriota bacterium]
MRVALQKIEGVDSVRVSLNEGIADVRLKEGNEVTIEQVRQIATDSGFTPRGAEVEVAGTIVSHREAGQVAFRVTGQDLIYILVDDPKSEGAVRRLRKRPPEHEIVVSGFVPEERKVNEPRALYLREFERREQRKAAQ